MTLDSLPSGWSAQYLGDVFSFRGGGTPDKKNSAYWGGDIPWASVKDIKSKYLDKTIDQITEKGLSESATHLAKIGDLVLLTRIEPGKTAIVKKSVAVNQDCKIATPNGCVDIYWAYYLFKSLEREFIKRSSGTTVLGIRLNDINAIPLALPPLNEQKRIVAKIEELFSELDNGIAALKTAREQLKVYRQAVLKHAFEGKLTEKWREENKDKLETPERLLARIQQEREARYQQQMDEWQLAVKEWEENGKEGKKPKKPRPLDTSISDEQSPEHSLPYEWVWCKIKDIFSDLTDYHANGSYEVLKENVELKDSPDYAIMIRATNFEKNNFESDQKYITKDAYEFLNKSKLFGGEILVGKIGNAGKVYCMPTLNKPASLAMNLFCLKFTEVNSSFIYYQMISSKTKEQISRYVKGVGNPTIDKKSLRSINIVLPSISEQNYLVELIESIFSQIDHLESDILKHINRSETLRQSILKKAFSGQLVPQDTNDEPASELLARIKAEKAAEEEKAKSTKKKPAVKRTRKGSKKVKEAAV